MKTISNCLTYDGDDEIKSHILYMSGSKLTVVGNVEFTVFGTVRMNGVKLMDTSMNVLLATQKTFEVQKDSGLLFHKAPLTVKKMDEHVPVPDIPDMLDERTHQLHMILNEWAKSKGLVQQTEDIEDNSFDDDYDEDDFEYNIPLDTDSLVIEDENHSNVLSLSTAQAPEPTGDPEHVAGGTETIGDELEAEPDIENGAR